MTLSLHQNSENFIKLDDVLKTGQTVNILYLLCDLFHQHTDMTFNNYSHEPRKIDLYVFQSPKNRFT